MLKISTENNEIRQKTNKKQRKQWFFVKINKVQNLEDWKKMKKTQIN